MPLPGANGQSPSLEADPAGPVVPAVASDDGDGARGGREQSALDGARVEHARAISISTRVIAGVLEERRCGESCMKFELTYLIESMLSKFAVRHREFGRRLTYRITSGFILARVMGLLSCLAPNSL